MLPSWFAYVATLLIVWGTIGYIRDVHRGRVTPNLVTWFLWSLAPLIALGAQLKAGVGPEAALAAAAGLCPLTVFIAGLKQGAFKPQPFDWWCGAMSLLALTLWLISGNGVVGVGLSIVADAFGAAPTLRKSWRNPTSESPSFFVLFVLSAALTLMTVTQWTIVNAAFSIYILVLYVVLFVLVQFRVGQLFKKSLTPLTDEA
jgi:hypothetical protein